MNLETVNFTKRWIQWTLDFVQTDLNSLSKSKFRGLCVEMDFFSGSGFRKGERGFEQLLMYNYFDKLPEIQVCNFDEALLNQMRKQDHNVTKEHPDCFGKVTIEELEIQLAGVGKLLPFLQRALKIFLDDTQDLLKKPRMKFSPIIGKELPVLEVDLPETENRLEIKLIRGEFYWYVVSVPKGYSPQSWAIMNLASLMIDLSVVAITTCKGCGRYFSNLSNRVKLYCNSSCASRSIAHKRYEELKKDPKKYEAHLKRYRKLSGDYYERLRKTQYGPNVKIKKNGRKEG